MAGERRRSQASASCWRVAPYRAPMVSSVASAAASPRRSYQPPRIIHEADLEVRAGSPLVAPDDPRLGQPWYQETGQQSFP